MNYDDNGNFAPLPMVQIAAKDGAGTVLAQTSAVLSVSDEISCNICHASNSDPAAMPARGWVNDPDPWRDTKLNILLKHDNRFNIAPYRAQLKANGYSTRKPFMPRRRAERLCSVPRHSDNALGCPVCLASARRRATCTRCMVPRFCNPTA